MKINALWSALRGHAQQPDDQKVSQQEDKRRNAPCSLDELDARVKALDEFLHENDGKKTQAKPTPPAASQRADKDKSPNALRTWFVLKALSDGEGEAAQNQPPGRLVVGSTTRPRP